MISDIILLSDLFKINLMTIYFANKYIPLTYNMKILLCIVLQKRVYKFTADTVRVSIRKNSKFDL